MGGRNEPVKKQAMILRRNTEPENKGFFTRVAPIMPYVVRAGIIFQIISAITEAFGIYQFGEALNAPLIVNLFFTLAVVIGWELLIRVSSEYVTKTATLRIRKEIKLEQLEGVLIAIALLIGIPLIVYSYTVSKENAHMTFQFMMPEQDTTKVASIQVAKTEDLSSIKEDYLQRKAEIEKMFLDQSRAAKGVYDADKASINSTINQYREKERRTGQKYTTKINGENDKLNNSYEEYKEKVSLITTEKNAALQDLSAWRSGLESNALGFASDELDEDKGRKEAFKAWYTKYSYIWSHFAGLCAILAVLCVIFGAVFKVLAGIKEETHLTPENLEPGLWSEIYYLIQLTITSPIRNRVRNAINETASKRVQLEIVTPSTINVTPTSYAPPHVDSRSVTRVSQSLRSETVTPVTPVTRSVTENSYKTPVTEAKHELPTQVTPVTHGSVTHQGGSALLKPESVTNPEAVVVELSPTVMGTKPEKKKNVTDSGLKVIMVGPTKAVITGNKGEKETVTLQQVGNRKRANFGNIEKRKTQAAKENARRLYEFYRDLEARMKEAKV